MKGVIKENPEFVVLTEAKRGFTTKTEVTRCANFKTAVEVYKMLCGINGPYSTRIFMEVVGYGEAL